MDWMGEEELEANLALADPATHAGPAAQILTVVPRVATHSPA